MSLTNRYYGGTSMGNGRTIQDFGLCDISGSYVYTTRLRARGLLVVVFAAPDSDASSNVLKAVQSWTAELGADKWTALAVCGTDKATLSKYAESLALSGVTVVTDHDLYQTRTWGVSHMPTTYLIDGKSGRALSKVTGDSSDQLAQVKQLLADGIAKIKAAEEAAKKAEEEKKAAEAAAKAAEAASKPEPAKA